MDFFIEPLALEPLEAYVISFAYCFSCLIVQKEGFFYSFFLSLIASIFLMILLFIASIFGILGLFILWISILINPLLTECDYIDDI